MLKALANLWQRRERARWIDVEADALVRVFGDGAHAAARKKVREASDMSAMRYWGAVKEAVAGGTGLTQTIGGLCETVPPIESHRSPAQAHEFTEFELENPDTKKFCRAVLSNIK